MPNEDTRREAPLQGWKEIAAYLERDQRTARRWEAEEGLPVRRHRTDRRSSVYAYPSEIDAWRASRPPKPPAESPAGESFQRPRRLWAAAAALALVGGSLLLLRTARVDPIAEAGAAGTGVRTLEICAECDPLGDLSPDGRYLSENTWDGPSGNGDIAVRDLETGVLRRLTDNQADPPEYLHGEHSVFSPDGKQIAYPWDAIGSDGRYHTELRLIEAFGEEPRPRKVFSSPEIASIHPHAWTRDQRLLVWFRRHDWSRGIGFVSIETGELVVLKSFRVDDFGSPTLSPDERWVAYDVPLGPRRLRNVFLLSSNGEIEREVAPHPDNDFVVGFTPDSKTLLIGSNRTGENALWGVDVASTEPSEPRLLLRGLGPIYPMAVMDDGALVYQKVTGGVDLYSAQLDLQTGKLLRKPRKIDTERVGQNEGPWFSPDGRRMAYFPFPNSLLGRGHAFYRPVLRIREVESAAEREIWGDGFRFSPYYGFAWSPDGSRALTSFRDERGEWGLCEILIETGEVRQLLRGKHLRWPIGWTVDGRSVIYSFHRPGERSEDPWDRAIERIGDEGVTRIYTASRNLLGGSLSAQRDRIAWREKEGRSWKIQVLKLDEGRPKVVFETREGDAIITSPPAWTPDGEAVLVTLGPNVPDGATTVWSIPLDGSAPRETGLTEKGLRQLQVAQDGKTVYFRAGSQSKRIFKTENYLPAADARSE